MTTTGAPPPPAIEPLIVETLPDDDRQVLRQGAVLRYITRELAEVVTGSTQAARRLVEHPVLQGGDQGRADALWTIPEPLRRALLSGWNAADEVRARVADRTGGLEARYARLATAGTRGAALTALEEEFTRALGNGQVVRAHDLLRLLDEWPVTEDGAASALRERLAPALRRHSRALPDREATEHYQERDFEAALWALLLDDGRRWMLHLHAPGGRGKTMFVKSLLGRRCPAEDIPVARIDFDYVARLGIATTEPWRLLLSVAAQLDPQLPNSPFRFLLDSYGELQDVVRPEGLPPVRPRTVIGSSTGPGVDERAVDAAQQVPPKFRAELATALAGGPVVIALDTVENVLHTDGADLAAVLAAFGDLVRSPGPDRVPGLRLVVSGRFDLAGDRPLPGGRTRQRLPGFREHWVGQDEEVECRDLGDTPVALGREVITLGVPGFSPEEAHRFLNAQRPAIPDDVITAIVARIHDNPMKLALLAEYAQRHPTIRAETITEIDEDDLFYLVDRVVDRIPDGRVQWLLRWGALLPVITREAPEQVLWPALESFVHTRPGYDNSAADGMPPSPEDVRRWQIPYPAEIDHPGAREESWRVLLGYAARASWVSVVPDLPDTVVLHPEVRAPLRRLRRRGLPVYDDIHRRSFAYWRRGVDAAEGALRSTAPRALLFHAYQPWTGAPHDGDRLFGELLVRRATDRAAREGLAREVLELAGAEPDAVGGPSVMAQELAHLELAEAAVVTAGAQGGVVAEGAVAGHLNRITGNLRDREPRRIVFLEAMLLEASGRVDPGWAALDRAFRHPPPGSDLEETHLAVMAAWIGTRTPPRWAVDVLRRFPARHDGIKVETAVRTALARGLLAAQRWPEALEAARQAWSSALVGAALIGLGDVDAVLADPDSPRELRARAQLLRYDATAALWTRDKIE